MKCADLTDRRLLDHIYDKSPSVDTEALARHLAKCESCRNRADQIGGVLTALNAVESDHKLTTITELDQNGASTTYIWANWPNETAETMQALDGSGDHAGLSYVSVQGEEASFELVSPESEEDVARFKLHLPRPILPGERVELLMVHHAKRDGAVQKLDNGNWRFGPGKIVLSDQCVCVLALRLPAGAALVAATPPANEVRTNQTTTLLWRNVLPPDKLFEFWVEYRL